MNSAGYTPEEPIAAIATALAPAALGIVRCSGKGVIELLAPLFSRPKALLSAEGNTIVYGWLTEPAAGQGAVQGGGVAAGDTAETAVVADGRNQFGFRNPGHSSADDDDKRSFLQDRRTECDR